LAGGPGPTGRRPPINTGENNGRAKLTWAAVKLIRQQYAKGEATQLELATHHGLSKTAIGDIIRNQRWIDPEYTPPGHRFVVSELDWDDVRRIRQQYAEGGTTLAKLAETYGLTPAAIGHIIRNRNWFDPNYGPRVRKP
jgi:DNA-binding XRE family transcriptional regulator